MAKDSFGGSDMLCPYMVLNKSHENKTYFFTQIIPKSNQKYKS
ncbi:hypothetical protein [Moraxella lacunata]